MRDDEVLSEYEGGQSESGPNPSLADQAVTGVGKQWRCLEFKSEGFALTATNNRSAQRDLPRLIACMDVGEEYTIDPR